MKLVESVEIVNILLGLGSSSTLMCLEVHMKYHVDVDTKRRHEHAH